LPADIARKTHGAGDAALVGPTRSSAIEEMGSAGRASSHPGKARRDHRRPEVTWTTTQRSGANNYFENLFGNEWELTKSPAVRFSSKRKATSHDIRIP